jgi:hypothetical protein
MALMMTRSSWDNHFLPPSVQVTPREGDSLCSPSERVLWPLSWGQPDSNWHQPTKRQQCKCGVMII